MIEGAAPKSAGRAAQHCEELLANSAEAVDIAGDFARFGTRVARALQPRLAKLFDARKLETELVETGKTDAANVADTLGEKMHHARFALSGKGLGILASASVASLIGEFDRMLGGDGEGPADAVALPSSADRFARQIEAEIMDACSEASARSDIAAAHRGTDLSEIVPAAARAPIHVATIAVIRPGVPKLIVKIATCETTFIQFPGEAPVGKPVRRSLGEGPIEDSALANVELSMTATLVDMAIPLHRIVALQVGAMLQVPIHRSVPLTIADTTIAHGSIGAVDDRVALEIIHTALARNNQS